jgi:hypothetical protein
MEDADIFQDLVYTNDRTRRMGSPLSKLPNGGRMTLWTSPQSPAADPNVGEVESDARRRHMAGRSTRHPAEQQLLNAKSRFHALCHMLHTAVGDQLSTEIDHR